MGRDKALLPFAGRTLIEQALAILREAGLPASIAGARSPLAAFAPIVEDARPGLGPLSGICAALQSTSAQTAVFIPVDLPLIPASLIVYLLRHALITGRAVTIPSINGFAQTFPAVLCQSALPALACELDAGRRGCFAAFQVAAAHLGQPLTVLPVELLVQAGHVAHPQGLPPSRWFLNLNTEEDLWRARRHLAAPIA